MPAMRLDSRFLSDTLSCQNSKRHHFSLSLDRNFTELKIPEKNIVETTGKSGCTRPSNNVFKNNRNIKDD